MRSLHLTIPVNNVHLEARLYITPLPTASSPSSKPTPLPKLDRNTFPKITRLVTAAHPWSRLGGNMHFPVLSHHLPTTLVDPTTAVLTFNVRGVGLSTGSQPIPGFSGAEGEDFAAVEEAVSSFLNAEEVWRVGYSHGTIAALTAAPRPNLKGTLLISPAPTLFKLLTLFRGPTFQQGLEAALKRDEKLHLVYGTADEFTGAATFASLGGEGVIKTAIEGCGHFYTRGEDGRDLRSAIEGWIS